MLVGATGVFFFIVRTVPHMPRTLALLRPIFDLLPDLTGYFFAMAGLALVFIPEELKSLERHRKIRLVIAACIFLIGLGAVISNSVQKQEEKNSAKAERDKLTDQVTKLIVGQSTATQEAIKARAETQAVREELDKARTELAGRITKTETVLAGNINQYRTDTTTAVGKILRPARTLGDKRDALVKELKKAGSQEIAITVARGNQECLDFSNQIQQAFMDAGWKIGRTQFAFITKDANGLQLMVKSMIGKLRPDQMAVAVAFKSIGMQLLGAEMRDMKDDGPVELYVGLQ